MGLVRYPLPGPVEGLDLDALPASTLVGGRPAAQILNVPHNALRRLRERGVLPYVRITSRTFRYRIGDLRELASKTSRGIAA